LEEAPEQLHSDMPTIHMTPADTLITRVVTMMKTLAGTTAALGETLGRRCAPPTRAISLYD
jgi:hypothetical protein